MTNSANTAGDISPADASALARAAAQLGAELAAAQERAAELERALGNREHDIRALESRVLLAERQLAERAPVASSAADPSVAALQAQIVALHASTSWRITRPLRALMRLTGRG